MTWKHIVMGLCGFAFGFWACIPREMPLEPRWEVLVQDADGQGLSQAVVRQTRFDYATGAGRSEDVQHADSYGRVAFPAVSARTSPLLRSVTCLRLVVSDSQARCGFHQAILVKAAGYTVVGSQEAPLLLKGRGQLLTVTMRRP